MHDRYHYNALEVDEYKDYHPLHGTAAFRRMEIGSKLEPMRRLCECEDEHWFGIADFEDTAECSPEGFDPLEGVQLGIYLPGVHPLRPDVMHRAWGQAAMIHRYMRDPRWRLG